jgi:hypothetical protein
MPQISPQETLLTGFTAVSNVGLTKTKDSEYSNLQNVRGNFKFGSKRRGVQGMVTLSNAVLGIFDLKIDGDADSPDKIAVYDGAGNIILYDPTELTVLFEWLFASTVYLNLQSPDLNWWEVYPDATTGILKCNGVAAPASTTSTDLFIPNNALYGFVASTTKIYRVYVSIENINQPRVAVKQYGNSSAVTTYTSVVGYTTGSGPVFQDNLLRNHRLRVLNGGFLNIIQVA